MKQSQLFAAMPKQPEKPKCILELQEARRREGEEDEAMLDRHWNEPEEPIEDLSE